MDFLITLFTIAFIGILLFQMIEFIKNESTPEISVPAKLVDKNMRSSSNVDANGISSQSITYYLLFELENGDRLEFMVGHGKYKLYVIGDSGILRYQRKRFNSLDR